MRHLIDTVDFSVEELEQVIRLGLQIVENPKAYSDACRGKILATLFFEPSTRTRLSFTSAMLSLGGTVLGFSDAANSSVSKGETVADTARTVSCFADIIAMRHPKEGAPLVASRYGSVPVINAGDGGHCHPTQTLTDLLTIRREKGRFDHLTVGLVGDLKYGRTVHSLIKALSRYEGTRFVLISPEELCLPDYIKQECDRSGVSYTEARSIEEAIGELDVLYMTRVQRERFNDLAEYERLKDCFILDAKKMKLARPDMVVLHPLPRVNEIAVEVDDDPRAAYFRQVENGRYVRMALICKLLEWSEADRAAGRRAQEEPYVRLDHRCTNPRCICSIERAVPLYVRDAEREGVYHCAYCETHVKL